MGEGSTDTQQGKGKRRKKTDSGGRVVRRRATDGWEQKPAHTHTRTHTYPRVKREKKEKERKKKKRKSEYENKIGKKKEKRK